MSECRINYRDRTNKRKALNYIFKNAERKIDDKFVYVTLASSEILDVGDLLRVFREDQIAQIIAYERDIETANEAEKSAFAKQFEGKIKIVNENFPDLLDEYLEDYNGIQKIVFFDGLEWFCNKKGSDTRTKFQQLLDENILGHKDIYIISSSVAHRAWGTIVNEIETLFQYYKSYNHNYCEELYGEELELMLKDNVVDLNVESAVRNYNSYKVKMGGKKRIVSERLGKIRYNDISHIVMDLQGFHFVETSNFTENLEIPFKHDKKLMGSRRVDDILARFRSG